MAVRIIRAGPLATLQDAGRPGLLRYGVSASGPMDRRAFERAGNWLGNAGTGGIEFTAAGLGFTVEEGGVSAAFDGGLFELVINGVRRQWPSRAMLKAGTAIEITPGPAGNYGYVRFDREIDVPLVLGSRATSSIARLGGLEGRALAAGDVLRLGAQLPRAPSQHPRLVEGENGPIRVIWGIHAGIFDNATRERFAAEAFAVSPQLDRMGVRLLDAAGVFSGANVLSLVSDAVVPGDIQILGDGTPIVLMRDHQPTGGYPRIATVVTADLDRFAQMRPGTRVRFEPISVVHAQELLR